MDKSKVYIEMCEKAKEIQKLKPLGKSLNAWGKDDLSIWLPRQDQLQEMIDRSILNETSLALAKRFGKWLENNSFIGSCLTEIVRKNSMEQLWLAFVMKEKYNKTWNGEDWIREE